MYWRLLTPIFRIFHRESFPVFFNPPCLSSEATPPKQNQHQQPQIMEVVTSMQRHKILTLTKTYLTLSLVEIANEAGLSNTREAEDILFDMISEGEIKGPATWMKPYEGRRLFGAGFHQVEAGRGVVGSFLWKFMGVFVLFKGGICWARVLVYQVCMCVHRLWSWFRGGETLPPKCVVLGGGFKYFLCSSLLGEMIQFDEHIFQMGWNHQV